MTYPELVESNILRLKVVASEIGGRLNYVARNLLEVAAFHRAQTEPKVLRRQAARA